MHPLAIGATVLAFATPAHHPGCPKTFTVKMAERAAQAVYAGTRDVSKRNLRMLGRIEMCQRNPQHHELVTSYDHHQADAHHARLEPTWAIPWPIVNCESRGQNLPPNSAGASGYYQIIPTTWSSYGGAGGAAYLAPKAEQDAVASRIWDGGAGASQWVCAGLTGY